MANTSNFIIISSNVMSTRITNLSSGSVPTVENVFPLFNGSHFQQINNGLNPNTISIFTPYGNGWSRGHNNTNYMTALGSSFPTNNLYTKNT